MADKWEPIHLSDGAYASPGSYRGEVILTANHHDLGLASDAVYLDPRAVVALRDLLDTIIASWGVVTPQ